MTHDPSDDPYISKSALKREALRLQDLGKALATLKRAQLEALALPDRLAQAIFDYQRFTSHEARRRQLQYVGRLMRDVATAPIEAALADLRGASADARYRMHQAEQWRERLLAEPAALQAFLTEYPQADRQVLRRALQRALKPAGEAQQKSAARALFRVLREQLADEGSPGTETAAVAGAQVED